jgi:hypothetical protein
MFLTLKGNMVIINLTRYEPPDALTELNKLINQMSGIPTVVKTIPDEIVITDKQAKVILHDLFHVKIDDHTLNIKIVHHDT